MRGAGEQAGRTGREESSDSVRVRLFSAPPSIAVPAPKSNALPQRSPKQAGFFYAASRFPAASEKFFCTKDLLSQLFSDKIHLVPKPPAAPDKVY
ncbi:MAG TPA: hypothetical protein DDW78_02995 [Treponema sp.]|nr:hypothetical protein [Treponema sp.]